MTRPAVTILPALALVLMSALPASASPHCSAGLAADRNLEDIRKVAAAAGYTDIHEIEKDDGCYKVETRDASGNRVEIRIHPESLEIVSIENDD